VVEMGCRALREDARGGVPDLPEVQAAPVAPEVSAPVPSLLGQRQARLNKEMGW
jgi:hypothetical protein